MKKFLDFLHPFLKEGTMFNTKMETDADKPRAKQAKKRKRSHGKKKGNTANMLIMKQLTQVDGQDVPFLLGNLALPATKGNQKRKLPAQYGASTTKKA